MISFARYVYVYVNELVSFFVFMEWVQLPRDHVLVLEDRTFHGEVLSILYRNNIFIILANFNLVLSTS